ncbi:hypothetical protein BurJ1DRAFT_2556 [Burkholderiales bacterium JOSHI_001]|nr:hypothetical protein BurJ1DRAFT_2556 [Burkholderiales bacterium JOSHI_001]
MQSGTPHAKAFAEFKAAGQRASDAISSAKAAGRQIETDADVLAQVQATRDAEAQCRALADPRVGEAIATLRQAHQLTQTHSGELRAVFGRTADGVASALTDAIKKAEALQLAPATGPEVEAVLGETFFTLAVRLGPVALWHRWQSTIQLPALSRKQRRIREATLKKAGRLQ